MHGRSGMLTRLFAPNGTWSDGIPTTSGFPADRGGEVGRTAIRTDRVKYDQPHIFTRAGGRSVRLRVA